MSTDDYNYIVKAVDDDSYNHLVRVVGSGSSSSGSPAFIVVDPDATESEGSVYNDLQDAIDYAESSGATKTVIFVVEGVYEFEETVQIQGSIEIVGAGCGKTIFRFKYNASNRWVHGNTASGRPNDIYAIYFGNDDGATPPVETRAEFDDFGVTNLTIELWSERLTAIRGYFEPDYGQHFEYHHIRVVKRYDDTYTYSNGYAIDMSNKGTSTYREDTLCGFISEIDISGVEYGSGTISCSGTTAVVGTDTAFTTECSVGTNLKINGNFYEIASITDDTHLTLTSNGPSVSGAKYLTACKMGGGICIESTSQAKPQVCAIENIRYSYVRKNAIRFYQVAGAHVCNLSLYNCGLSTTIAADTMFDVSYSYALRFSNVSVHRRDLLSAYTGKMYLFYVISSSILFTKIHLEGGGTVVSWYRGFHLQYANNCTFRDITVEDYTTDNAQLYVNSSDYVVIDNFQHTGTSGGSVGITLDRLSNHYTIVNSTCGERSSVRGDHGVVSNCKFLAAFDTDGYAPDDLQITNCYLATIAWWSGVGDGGVFANNTVGNLDTLAGGLGDWYYFKANATAKVHDNTFVVPVWNRKPDGSGGYDDFSKFYVTEADFHNNRLVCSFSTAQTVEPFVAASDVAIFDKNVIKDFPDTASSTILEVDGNYNVVSGNVYDVAAAYANAKVCDLLATSSSSMVNNNIFRGVPTDAGSGNQRLDNITT